MSRRVRRFRNIRNNGRGSRFKRIDIVVRLRRNDLRVDVEEDVGEADDGGGVIGVVQERALEVGFGFVLEAFCGGEFAALFTVSIFTYD